MPSVKRCGAKGKVSGFEKKHGIPPEAVRKSKKPKPVRSDAMGKGKVQVCPKCGVEIDKTTKPRLRCPRCGQGIGVASKKPNPVRSDRMGHKMHYGYYIVKGKETACGIKDGNAWAGTLTFNPKNVTCVKCKKAMKKNNLGW